MSDETELPRPKPGLEIATTGDGLDITQPYIGPLKLPRDGLLNSRGGDLSLYESVLSEPQVHVAFQQRRLAVVSREWDVEPASDRREDRKAAEFIKAQLHRIGFDARTNGMLYGVFYGFAVAELLYGVEGGQIVLDAIKVRNRRRFRFGTDGALRMLTPGDMFRGVELPPAKFWSFATGSDNDDDPYGIGLGHWCYWPAYFKRNGVKFWLNFAEKYASPTAVGEFEPGTSDKDQKKLLAATQAVQTDSGLIIPKGMMLRLLEVTRNGTADYKALHDAMDETIAKVILGQVASTQGQAGKLGEETLQSDVRADIVKADADLVCESFNQGPVQWLTRWNFPNADPPRVYRVLDEAEDLAARAVRDKALFDMGFRPTLVYVQQTYGGEWTEREPTPSAVAGDAQFAAASEASIPDALADAMATQAAGAWEATLDRVFAIVDAAPDMATLRDQLQAAYGELPHDELAQVIGTGMAAAELAGRFDASQEAHGG